MKVNIDLLEKVRDSLVLVLTEKGYHTPFHYKLSPDEENIFVFHLQIVDRTNARLNSKLQGYLEKDFPGKLSFVLQTDALDIDTTILYKSIKCNPIEESPEIIIVPPAIEDNNILLGVQFFELPIRKKPSHYTNIRTFMNSKNTAASSVFQKLLLRTILSDAC